MHTHTRHTSDTLHSPISSHETICSSYSIDSSLPRRPLSATVTVVTAAPFAVVKRQEKCNNKCPIYPGKICVLVEKPNAPVEFKYFKSQCEIDAAKCESPDTKFGQASYDNCLQ
ncbi:hypothetical protein BGX29_005784 [Mortierella sp. GBA35]|nr:hypothetical protein BGX29_005784 [Mortierella sp. GBA35]